MTMPKITFVGSGLMGFPMARRLAEAKFAVTVWNRTRDKALPLQGVGAVIADDLIGAVADADVIIMMLENVAAVDAVMTALTTSQALKSGGVIIDMSSIPPESAQTMAQTLMAINVDHLDAPVSGGTKGADAGTLAIMVGGSFAVFDRVTDILNVLGQPTWVGPSGSGQLAKLANQVMVAVTIGAVAEGLLLAATGGADSARVRDSLLNGFANSEILRQHGKRMIDGDFSPGGPMRIFNKDLRAVMAQATRLGLELPLFAHAFNVCAGFLEPDRAQMDHSAYILALETSQTNTETVFFPQRK